MRFSKYAAWSAYLSAGAFVGSLALSISLVALGQLHPETRSHSALVEAFDSVFLLSLAPVAVSLDRLLAPRFFVLSRVALGLGLVAILADGALHIAFSLGITFLIDALLPFAIFGLGILAWVWLIGVLGQSSGQLPWGIAMALVATSIIGFPIWAIWIGRRLAAQRAMAGGQRLP
jgi:hypothetical protein